MAVIDLSKKEREIAHRAANGMSNIDIAGELNLAEGTVKFHLYNLYRKLGVRNKTQLIRDYANTLQRMPNSEVMATRRKPRLARTD